MTDVTRPGKGIRAMLSTSILVLALLALAPLASAATDPVASGQTKLYLKKGFEKKLDNLDVRIQRWGSGSFNGRRIVLDAEGGSVDPLTGKGKVEHKKNDGFRFRRGKRSVPVSELEVNTRKNWVRANVAGAKMRLGWLASRSHGRLGFGAYLQSRQLKLTGNAARRISNRLGIRNALGGGRVISNSYTTVQPSTTAVLPTGNTSLTLSPVALLKLSTVGPEFPPASGEFPFAVKLELEPPAAVLGLTPLKTPIAGFPIGGGTISPAGTGGTVQHLGGIKLTQDLEALEANGKGQTTVELKEIWLDLSTNVATVEVVITNPKVPELNKGSVGRISIADVSLAGATIGSDPVNRQVSIADGSATLQELTAATLNEVFFGPLEEPGGFAAGDPLGTFSFTAQAQ